MKPYYADDKVTLYHGTIQEVLPSLGVTADLIMADPPYGETSLAWDRWPQGWPTLAAGHGRSLWCFGSMRMFLARRDEFTAWRLSQDIVWEKHNGSGFAADRMRRVHEHAVHWYHGGWNQIHHVVPRTPPTFHRHSQIGEFSRGNPPSHTGTIAAGMYMDDGLRLQRSVITSPSMHGSAINETEKPAGVLEPLISYGCPPGGLILDLFAGSCSASVAARALGRRSIAIEAREEQCEKAAKRLAQDCLPLEAS